ncbi:MAG: hypothetical protein N0C81_02325 [Candidatus Thiodiazotropha lotti]|uniref:Uncharacterized protein n=1 Tax=Candidatus Thiodiazotropha lotti TaxID=2792787 RepID=A0A9E4K6L7_9GAMM|nr:hypothetical protein [Candidatus Thiodiazotropha lotti]MCG7921270.1 hypothetical protein [Candidatus Thiodiazotropha lotti]MCG7930237.1 hypothetical protein [Candidatus Thiodiazotropha lotti]MCG7939833.1 hypothetical protein [Candidatus Thiodiazotropha lotti]MCG8005002.1 hypothetical protein [Candidatus Thiodiazotropha lotti]
MRQIKLIQSLFLLSLLSSLSIGNQLHAMQSEYVDAIKADYHEFNSGTFEPPPELTWVGAVSTDTSNAGLAYENLQDFSLFLKEASPGSFIFYNKLPDQYKDQLHQQYLKTGNLDEIKKDIFKYSSEIKKQNPN